MDGSAFADVAAQEFTKRRAHRVRSDVPRSRGEGVVPLTQELQRCGAAPVLQEMKERAKARCSPRLDTQGVTADQHPKCLRAALSLVSWSQADVSSWPKHDGRREPRPAMAWRSHADMQAQGSRPRSHVYHVDRRAPARYCANWISGARSKALGAGGGIL
jgi:hypothetical protein